jgi:hypothetical protein
MEVVIVVIGLLAFAAGYGLHAYLSRRRRHLLRIIGGADATDDEDVFLRGSLVVTLRALYTSERSAASDRFLRRLARFRPRVDWGLAASLVAVITAFGGGAMWGGRAPSERADLLEEVAGYHQIYSRETRHLVEVPADQIEELTAWLGEP